MDMSVVEIKKKKCFSYKMDWFTAKNSERDIWEAQSYAEFRFHVIFNNLNCKVWEMHFARNCQHEFLLRILCCNRNKHFHLIIQIQNWPISIDVNWRRRERDLSNEPINQRKAHQYPHFFANGVRIIIIMLTRWIRPFSSTTTRTQTQNSAWTCLPRRWPSKSTGRSVQSRRSLNASSN